MKTNPFTTEHYELYLYEGESFFFAWDNWGVHGKFEFFYGDIVKKIVDTGYFKKDRLYNLSLFIERNPDNLSQWYRYEFDITAINPNEELIEIEQVATEVRDYNLRDCDLVANDLDTLYCHLKNKKMR